MYNIIGYNGRNMGIEKTCHRILRHNKRWYNKNQFNLGSGNLPGTITVLF